MIPELLLGTTFLAGGGVLGWLWKIHTDDKRRHKEEEARRRRLEEERHREHIDRLARRIGAGIKTAGLGTFRLGPFAQAAGIPLDEAEQAGRLIYSKSVSKVVADGVITPDERRQLDALASALGIDKATASLVEVEAKGERFRSEAIHATADGILTQEELAGLESLRRSLGLARDSAAEILGEEGRPIYFDLIERSIDAGVAYPATRASAERLRSGIFPGGVIPEDYRSRVDDLYRKALAMVLQDGIVDEAEKELLAWLKAELRPSRGEVEDAEQRVGRVVRLSRFRSGDLPSIPTSALLESGELCYYECSCHYYREMKRGTNRYSGTLLVTSKKVRFLSAEHSLAIVPSRIMDIVISGRALRLTLDMRQGSAVFGVSDPEEVEAILVGVARRSKYAADYSAERSRLIPQHVKQQVWARDGGRCVKCGIAHALEFDHIIPHSRGGASTVDNVQVLCRPCNLEKGDRI
jgi:hypothetical protein